MREVVTRYSTLDGSGSGVPGNDLVRLSAVGINSLLWLVADFGGIYTEPLPN
jgi:hypothetical protein